MGTDDFDPSTLFEGLGLHGPPPIQYQPIELDEEWVAEVQQRNALADQANQRTIEMAQLLEKALRNQQEQAAEYARREAEQVAREEHALDLAAKSHQEAVESKEETRRARKLAAWSLAVAVLALLAAVVVPLITG